MQEKIDYRTVLGFIGSAILLWLTFHNSGLKFQDIVLNNQQLFYFVTSIVIFIFSVWLCSIRAKTLWVNQTIKYSDIKTYNGLIVGNFYNCLLPGNLGEGVRAWHFSRKNQVPFLRSLAAIITEKWIDAQLFFPLSIILFVSKPFVSHYILFAFVLTLSIILLLSIIYQMMGKYRSFEKRVCLIVLSFKKIGRILFRLYWHTKNHIANLKNNGLRIYLILCMFILLLNVSQFFCLLKAADVNDLIAGWYCAFLTALSMMIIVIVPSAPSNIGVMHYGIYSVLILTSHQFGIEPDVEDLKSFARFAVYVHLSYVIPEVLMGVLFVMKERKMIFHKKI